MPTPKPPLCSNEDHNPRPAVVRLSWPDGRFKPDTACRRCLHMLLVDYVTGDTDGEPHAVLVEPIEAGA